MRSRVFSVQLLHCLRIMIPIFAKEDRKGGVFEVAGLTLASVLLAFEMLTVCKYWVYLRVLSQKTLGLRWRRSDAQPHRGHELLNGSLCEALASGKLCFSPEDLQRLGVSGLQAGSYIKVGEAFYQPYGLHADAFDQPINDESTQLTASELQPLECKSPPASPPAALPPSQPHHCSSPSVQASTTNSVVVEDTASEQEAPQAGCSTRLWASVLKHPMMQTRRLQARLKYMIARFDDHAPPSARPSNRLRRQRAQEETKCRLGGGAAMGRTVAAKVAVVASAAKQARVASANGSRRRWTHATGCRDYWSAAATAATASATSRQTPFSRGPS
jgi:hypothetical protein